MKSHPFILYYWFTDLEKGGYVQNSLVFRTKEQAIAWVERNHEKFGIYTYDVELDDSLFPDFDVTDTEYDYDEVA